MEVTVIPFNVEEIVNKIYTACRTCYSVGTPQDQYEVAETTDYAKKWKLINHVISSGHHSTLEHVSFTFLISGVSRALSHQLVRHRIGICYSQQSQRYCKFEDGFEYVTPKSIMRDDTANKKYTRLMTNINKLYLELINECDIPAEDARMILPNACTTNITCTVNLRELIHLTDERCCTCAQDEIRRMVTQMAKLIWSEIPELKGYLGPKCQTLGYCNESPARSCGRKPTKDKAIINIYEPSKE